MPTPAQEPEKGSSSVIKRVALGAMTGLALLGMAGGLTTYAMASAPVCDVQSVAIQDGRVCISPEYANNGATVWRVVRGAPFVDDFAADVIGTQNRVYQPGSEAVPPSSLPDDGSLRVVTWNLHHLQSPNGEGSRDMADGQIRFMRDQAAPVYLLQEVNPWDVQQIVDGTGMVGYFTTTSPQQGNLILVHPELPVEADAHVVLNRDVRVGHYGDAADMVGDWSQQKIQPRVAQTVRVRLADGRSAVLWNTHLNSNQNFDDAENAAERAAETSKLLRFLGQQTQGAAIVIGGGDLNAKPGSPVMEALPDGWDMSGIRIDWIAEQGLAAAAVMRHAHPTDDAGAHLSDHPLVSVDYNLSTPS